MSNTSYNSGGVRCNTLIETDKGPIKISKIVEDQLDVKVRTKNGYRRIIEFQNLGCQPCVVISARNKTLWATPNQQLKVSDTQNQWKDFPVEKVFPGRLLYFDFDGDFISGHADQVDQGGNCQVYNLKVADGEDYFANSFYVASAN